MDSIQQEGGLEADLEEAGEVDATGAVVAANKKLAVGNLPAGNLVVEKVAVENWDCSKALVVGNAAAVVQGVATVLQRLEQAGELVHRSHTEMEHLADTVAAEEAVVEEVQEEQTADYMNHGNVLGPLQVKDLEALAVVNQAGLSRVADPHWTFPGF